MHTRYRICLQVTLRLICSKIRINLFLPTSSFLYTKGFGKTSGVGTNLTHGSTAGDAHRAGMEAGGHSTARGRHRPSRAQEGSSKITPVRNSPAWPQAQKQQAQSLWGKAPSLGLLSSPSQPSWCCNTTISPGE